MSTNEKMLSMEEMIKDRHFANALNTFYWIQEWGAKHYKDGQRTGLKISDMLDQDENWKKLSDTEHQEIGKLIAYNFPNLAALCTIPVYVVFEQSDENNKGVYRFATYTDENV